MYHGVRVRRMRQRSSLIRDGGEGRVYKRGGTKITRVSLLMEGESVKKERVVLKREGFLTTDIEKCRLDQKVPPS